MPTLPGQLVNQMRERFTATVDRIEAEIEDHMKSLSELESDGSFEMQTDFSLAINATTLALLNERYGRPDGSGWTVKFNSPNLLELVPQKLPAVPSGRLDR
jgi:hypothetical protein